MKLGIGLWYSFHHCQLLWWTIGGGGVMVVAIVVLDVAVMCCWWWWWPLSSLGAPLLVVYKREKR